MSILTKSSKEIIDSEYKKIALIAKHLKDTGHSYDEPFKVALAIYSKRHKDISVTDDEDD